MSERKLSESIIVETDPMTVYELVTDIARTGEWSPICRESWWDEGDGPTPGSWLTGRNESEGRTWETRSRVVVADPGREFRWQVGGEYVVWAYLMEPVEADGRSRTELTETWHLNEATVQMFGESYGDEAQQRLDVRTAEARAGIPETLARIKAIVEA